MKQNDLRSLKNDPQSLHEAATTIDPSTMRNVQETMKRFSGKDKTELMEELRVMAARERAKGNLGDRQIDMIASSLSSVLNSEQKEQLMGLVKQIKSM